MLPGGVAVVSVNVEEATERRFDNGLCVETVRMTTLSQSKYKLRSRPCVAHLSPRRAGESKVCLNFFYRAAA
jgi:hypothetical protein